VTDRPVDGDPRGMLAPTDEALAVLAAAVSTHDADHATAEAAFHATAARGRPTLPRHVGTEVRLRYADASYRLEVFRTGPADYRVDTDRGRVDLTVTSQGPDRRVLAGNGTTAVVTVQADDGSFLVSIADREHRVVREDGSAVRAGWPAFVVEIAVTTGQDVEVGDRLCVLESMKMESTIVAPYAGKVASVDVVPNAQVETGAPLVHLATAAVFTSTTPTGATPVDFGPLVARPSDDERQAGTVFAALQNYLLGYDLDPQSLRALLADLRRTLATTRADDRELVDCEDALLDVFGDVSALSRPQPTEGSDELELRGHGAREYLVAYLQALDVESAGIPASFQARLSRALARYGVTGLRRTPELEHAVVWLYRSFGRATDLAPVITMILERRLAHRAAIAPLLGQDHRALLDRLAAAGQGRNQEVADLARDVRFRYVDEPLLEQSAAAAYAETERTFDAVIAEEQGAERDRLVGLIVACPQPLRPLLLRRWLVASGRADQPEREAILEAHLRRYYRIRELHGPRVHETDGVLLCSADYDEPVQVHIVLAYCPFDDAPRTCQAIATHLAGTRSDRTVVVDLVTWREGSRPDTEAMAEECQATLARCEFGVAVRQVDVTITSSGTAGAEPVPSALRTQQFTYRERDGRLVEDLQYRNLHPMLAERLELWRLANFALERLPSPEDVYLFRGVAHDNEHDVRLFALAEVRDLTAVRDDAGRLVALPQMERIGLLALAAMRRVLAASPPNLRPQLNRIVLYVRPPWDFPRGDWTRIGHAYSPLAAGSRLQKLVVCVRIPSGEGLRDTVLHVEGVGDGGVTVRERPVRDEPIRSLTRYQHKVLRAARLGVPYPYEIVKVLTPPTGMPSDLPVGWFEEYDLDAEDRLVRVDRPHGENTANIVVGVIANCTRKLPEGMRRVALLSDPVRGLGNLAEEECRRIIAGIDLAERLGVPLEWFALSSGARIAMDSGTENMDWIGAVLRRVIEFTQAGGEINVVVTGINVGAQPYWNAEATMLMHSKGILVMTADSAMVLTGKQALDFSGGMSADDNSGIGGYEAVMGPNGQAQYWAPTLVDACRVLLRHYEHAYVVPGERWPRRAVSVDPIDRDVRRSPHPRVDGSDFTTVGDVFSAEHNPERKKPFDIRCVMRAVVDADSDPLERWSRWRDAESTIVWDAHIGGVAVCLLGLESRTVARRGFVPADGPPTFTSGTLFPQSSRKLARAVNAASGNRPVVVLANLSGFDGSPESMRRWQLEYGAEIGRAVTNFRGPIVFVVVSRYHGGAFVVFSKRLNAGLEIAAVEGSYASVIGGAPAAAVVFAREVDARTDVDPRVAALRDGLAAADDGAAPRLWSELGRVRPVVRNEKLGDVAAEFDAIHSIRRALEVGSVDRIISAEELRPYIANALERGMAVETVVPRPVAEPSPIG